MSSHGALFLGLALLVLGSSATSSGDAAGSAAPSPALGALRGAVAAPSEMAGAEVGAAAAAELGCEDKNAQCGAWASSGECQSNPGYMLVWCKASCAVEGCGAAPTPTLPPAGGDIPGLADCLQHGFTINKCYQNEGFVDGDCKCVPGLWEGKYTWYQWICSTKGGQPHPTQFCSQDCAGGCHA